jgi:hypothetical protein
LNWGVLEQNLFKERGIAGARLPKSSRLLPRGDSEMTRRDCELLEKQLGAVSSSSPQNGIVILTMVLLFLVGMGIGDIVSKTKQANTQYAAISYPNEQN